MNGVPAERYATEHGISERRGRDRIRGKPAKLKALRAWASRAYQLEVPGRLHNRSLEEDGDPAMTGEAKGWLGMNQDGDQDWTRVACRVDKDGRYTTPLRCAVERMPPMRRSFLRSLLTELFHDRDVTRLHSIPDWCADDVSYRSLSMLWDAYSDAPIPRASWTSKSESQQAAELVEVG